ncbi:hypothetical protein AOLI_G00330470 [Acnodon oligacanthus]
MLKFMYKDVDVISGWFKVYCSACRRRVLVERVICDVIARDVTVILLFSGRPVSMAMACSGMSGKAQFWPFAPANTEVQLGCVNTMRFSLAGHGAGPEEGKQRTRC